MRASRSSLRRRIPAVLMLAAFVLGFMPGHAHGVTSHQTPEVGPAAHVQTDGAPSMADGHHTGHDLHVDGESADPAHQHDPGDPCPGCLCPTGTTSCGAVAPARAGSPGPAGPTSRRRTHPRLRPLTQTDPRTRFRPPRR